MTAKRIARAAVAAAIGLALPIAQFASALAREPASGARGFKPHIEGTVSVELRSDNIAKSAGDAAGFSDTFTKSNAGLTVHLLPFFQVVSTLVLEPVLDPTDDRFFEDHGAFAQELYGKLVFGDASVIGGKYNPAFGKAWDIAPGVYGTRFAEDYEMTERVGFAGIYEKAGTPWGDVSLMASVFQLDTSALSQSVFTNRGRTSRDDGGASNTGGLESFAFGGALGNVARSGVSFNLGVRHQAKGDGPDDFGDERGIVVGFNGEHAISPSTTLFWIAEAAMFANFNGGSADVDFLTAGVRLTFNDRYNVALVGAGRRVDDPVGPNYSDYLIQISAGTKLAYDWHLDLAYKWDEIEDVKAQTVGVLLKREFSFNTLGAR